MTHKIVILCKDAAAENVACLYHISSVRQVHLHYKQAIIPTTATSLQTQI